MLDVSPAVIAAPSHNGDDRSVDPHAKGMPPGATSPLAAPREDALANTIGTFF